MLAVGLAATPTRAARAEAAASPKAEASRGAPGGADDLSRARALDREGARAYTEGRYGDAIRYFEEALRLGAPPVELWNIAKCHDRIDRPEEAAAALERYLATPDLPRGEREEAQQMLDGLRRRPSPLTVTSSPEGATVTVDGRPVAGRTPTTVEVLAGRHEVTVARAGHEPHATTVEARYGRAVIVDVRLRPESASPHAMLRGLVGVQLPRFGEVGGRAGPALGALATLVVAEPGRTRLALGGMLGVAFDAWRDASGGGESAEPCGTLRGANDGVAITGYGVGSASWSLNPRVGASVLAGLGLAGYAAGQLGGDAFRPTCRASTGLRPAALLGVQADWALSSSFRLSLFPVLLHAQPAFDGARLTPLDASGPLVRVTFAVGFGFDP